MATRSDNHATDCPCSFCKSRLSDRNQRGVVAKSMACPVDGCGTTFRDSGRLYIQDFIGVTRRGVTVGFCSWECVGGYVIVQQLRAIDTAPATAAVVAPIVTAPPVKAKVTRPKATGDGVESKARAWALDTGMPCTTKGRVPRHVLDAYCDTHGIPRPAPVVVTKAPVDPQLIRTWATTNWPGTPVKPMGRIPTPVIAAYLHANPPVGGDPVTPHTSITDTTAPDRCPSCDGAIDPHTGECRCS